MMNMTNKENKILTQNELARVLQEKGYDEVNPRLLAEWRRDELLPAFDEIGGGRGKGQGRSENGWRNPRLVINQARWILRLRKLYPTLDDLYFPLWVLGYPISNDHMFDALCEPLDFMVEDLNETVNQFRSLTEPGRTQPGGHIQDIIDEAVYSSPVTKGLRAFGESRMPPETVEVGMNIFLNPDYKLNDLSFITGLFGLKKWREALRQKQSEKHAGTGADEASAAVYEDTSIEFIFKYAPFLKENLSLHRLQETMADCTAEVLLEVRRDMFALARTATTFGEMMRILMQDAREEFKPESFDALLPLLFSSAKLAAWTDISLRQEGYGEIINHLIGAMKTEMQQCLTEEKKRELAEFSPQFAAFLDETSVKLEESFKDLALSD